MAQKRKISLPEGYRQRVLQEIVDTLPYCIWWKDRNYVYLGTNQKNAQGAGLARPDEIVGLTDYDLPWTREETEHYIRVDEEVMSSGEPRLNIEETQHQINGEERVLLTSKVPLRDSEGRVFGIAGAWTDITDRKRMEIDLQRAKEAAERASEAKSAFLATVSHELRTPITLILGPLDQIIAEHGDTLPPNVHTELGRMYRSAVRLLFVVNDILDFSKAEADKLAPSYEWVDVAAATKLLVQDMTPMAENQGLELGFVGEEVGRAALDRQMYSRIVLNLVGNALKFSRKGGKTTVTVAAERQDRFRVTVTDDGIGIAPEHLETIFEKFAQVDSSAARRYEGTGLGLALVKRLTETLGGSVRVRSELGEGTTFDVVLPRRSADAAEIREAGAQAESGAGLDHWLRQLKRRHASSAPPAEPATASLASKARVLVVEDNDDMRAFIRDVLTPQYDVVVAKDGLEAQQKLESWQPTVILADIMMPMMSGIELVEWAKAQPELQQVPIILLTARQGVESVTRGLDCGADDYIKKPFAVEELKARVRCAVRMRNMQARVVELEKNALETQLAGGFAHEVRNTLGAANIFLKGAMRKDGSPEELEEALHGVARVLDRALTLTQEILDYSKMGEPPAQPETSDLGTVVARVLGELDTTLSERKIQVRQNSTGATPAVVSQVHLHSMVHNLVQNACDAMAELPPERERILELTSSRKGGEVWLEIRDSGAGIAKEIETKIFQPFFSTKPGTGTGLGLGIVRKLVTAYGGRISVSSEPGVGSTFSVVLPSPLTDNGPTSA